MKLLLICIIVVCGALSGRSLARSVERRYRLALATLHALEQLRVHVVDLIEPLGCALKSTGFGMFSAVADALAEGRRTLSAWNAVKAAFIKRGGAADCMGEDEQQALDRLFERLGETGRADQDTAICACISAMKLTCEQARTSAVRYGRLYTSLGTLTGLACAVLMI